MSAEIRPRFKRILTQDEKTVLSHFRKSMLTIRTHGLEGIVVGNHIIIKHPVDQQSMWTPELNISIDPHPKGTEVRGLAGPRSSIWLMFIFFYSLLGIASIFIFMFWVTRHQLGMSSGILWLIPVLLLIIGAMYLSARMGQKLSKDQLLKLKHYVRQILDDLEKNEI